LLCITNDFVIDYEDDERKRHLTKKYLNIHINFSSNEVGLFVIDFLARILPLAFSPAKYISKVGRLQQLKILEREIILLIIIPMLLNN